MKMHVGLFLFMSSIGSIFFCQPTFADNHDDIKAMQHPVLKKIALEQAKKYPTVTAASCKNNRFSPLDNYKIFSPLHYDETGKISQGFWRQAVQWEGCGQKRLLNVLMYVDERKETLYARAVAPGNTRTDPLLQKDIPTSAKHLLEAMSKIGQCESFYVDNTKFLREEKNPKEDSKGPLWEELWTFNFCSKKVEMVITFVPGSKGTPYTMQLKNK